MPNPPAAAFWSEIDWLSLLTGLAAGLLPPRLFYSGSCRHLNLTEARMSKIQDSPNGSAKRDGRRNRHPVLLHGLDPVRGYLCGHLLALGVASIPQPDTVSTYGVLLVKCALILLVLAVQMECGRQRSGKLIAPVAFWLGFMAGLYPGFLWAGAFVGVLTLTALFATQNFGWGYMIGGGAAAAICYPFFGPSPTSALFAATASAPAIYGFFRKRPLSIPLRKPG